MAALLKMTAAVATPPTPVSVPTGEDLMTRVRGLDDGEAHFAVPV